MLGLQFHLEMNRHGIQQIIENDASELIPGKYIQTSEKMLSENKNFAEIREVMYQFFELLSHQHQKASQPVWVTGMLFVLDSCESNDLT